MRAAIVTIGDEILIGQIVDTNAAWIAAALAEEGIDNVFRVTVGDDQQQIARALELAFDQATVVLVTGGLGPTRDDKTKSALAHYFGCDLVFSESTYEGIRQIFEKRGIPLAEAHRQQCYHPAAAQLIDNAVGTAPGMWFAIEAKILCSMPGVPHEMRYIMQHGVIPRLRAVSDSAFVKKTIRTVGQGETALADVIEPVLEGRGVAVAYLPAQGQVRLRLSAAGERSSLPLLRQRVDQAVEAIVPLLAGHVYGYDELTLEQHIGHLLIERGLTLSTAESCTGGHIAHSITTVPGSSRYYLGTIVAYSNDIKQQLLKVDLNDIGQYGAVSQQVSEAMALGCLNATKSDVAVAVTGISGPDGGTETKPVGTTWIAVAGRGRVVSRKFQFTKDRLLNIKYTTVYAFAELRRFLLGMEF